MVRIVVIQGSKWPNLRSTFGLNNVRWGRTFSVTKRNRDPVYWCLRVNNSGGKCVKLFPLSLVSTAKNSEVLICAACDSQMILYRHQ